MRAPVAIKLSQAFFFGYPKTATVRGYARYGLPEDSRRRDSRIRLNLSLFAVYTKGSVGPEWRNGRRSRLKIYRPQGHEGSSPPSGTTIRDLSLVSSLLSVVFALINTL
jgi:hypothetical protein